MDRNIFLTEGKYDFPFITNDRAIDVRTQIETALAEKGFKLPIKLRDDAQIKFNITGFDILDGKIDITVEKIYLDTRLNRRTVNTEIWDIKKTISEAKALKSSRAGDFIKSLAEIASDINAQLKPGLAVRRDNTVAGMLTDEIAEELKKHIKKIEYKIPLIDEYDFDVDKDNEPLTEKALRKLERIYGDFFNLSFASDAREAGMVKNRPATDDTNHNIEHSWRAVGTIVFDCPINKLSNEAQAVINAAKVKKAGDTTSAADSSNVASCYRLANALIKHFDNNVFFNRPNVTLIGNSDRLKENLSFATEFKLYENLWN